MLLRIEGSRVLLQGKATAALLAVLPRIEGRRHWLKAGGLSVENTPRNIEVLRELPNVTLVEEEEPSEFVLPPVSSYRPKTTPYEHQVRALEKMRGRTAFGLFMEQGTGKTKVTIDFACDLFCSERVTGVIVVSRKGVHRQWIESELPDHCGIDWDGAFWPLKRIPPELLLKRDGRLKWLAFNYEGLKTVAGINAAIAFARAHTGHLMIVADESQEIKNARSQRWAAMSKIGAMAQYRILLTGTPIAKDLADEWAQFKWADERILAIRYLSTFRSEFCIMGGFEGRQVIGHRNVDRFKALTEPYIFRATKSDIGILPKQYNRWTHELTIQQKDILRSLKRELEAELESGKVVSVANAISALVKFQQVASGFLLDEEGAAHRLMTIDANPRIQAALEWLAAGDGKAIIWIRFREDARLLAEALDACGDAFVEYHGGVSDNNRKAAISSFMDPAGARIFLANPASAGTGLNLQGLCSRALYYSNSFNSIDRWQSEDRIHRIGTNGIVTYTDMIGKGSIDGHIIKSLRRKKGLSDWVLGDIKELLQEI